MDTSIKEPPHVSDADLLALEARYCSHGDTVHYTDPPKIFSGCEGSYMYDRFGREYLDLQMWYSAVNFGYKNERLANAVRRQLDTLPQVASLGQPVTAQLGAQRPSGPQAYPERHCALVEQVARQ